MPKHKAKSKCTDCDDWGRSPLWGHSKCSFHRQCSGKDAWEPGKCDDCTKQKESVTELSDDDRNNFFQAMYDLLGHTSQFHSQVLNIEWVYKDKAREFFENYDLPEAIHEHDDNDAENNASARVQDATDDEYDDHYNQGENNDYNEQPYDNQGSRWLGHGSPDYNFNANNMQPSFQSHYNHTPQHAISHYDIYGRPLPYNTPNSN